MFIKNIKLQNFKGFEDITEIFFNNPLQDENSLNFFIGENNSGKSTIFGSNKFFIFLKWDRKGRGRWRVLMRRVGRWGGVGKYNY